MKINLPKTKPDETLQGEEFCYVVAAGEKKKIRFHDYETIYSIPGLYEDLFSERMKYQSPQVLCSLLKDLIDQSNASMTDLNVFDFGAGNGLSGEAIREIGANTIIGVDIIEAAKTATLRDRPNIYDDYLIADFTNPDRTTVSALKKRQLNCLATVGALGFDDIPIEAFINAFNVITSPGWVAFNIKEDFLADNDTTRYGVLLRRIIDANLLEIKTRHKYQHRLDWNDTPLIYEAIIGTKQGDIPEWFLEYH